jgi:hypothetical protein
MHDDPKRTNLFVPSIAPAPLLVAVTVLAPVPAVVTTEVATTNATEVGVVATKEHPAEMSDDANISRTTINKGISGIEYHEAPKFLEGPDCAL